MYLKCFAGTGPLDPPWVELQTLPFTSCFCHPGHHATNLKRRGETSSMSSLKSFAQCCRATATLSRWTSPPYCRGPSTSYRNRKVLRALPPSPWTFPLGGTGSAADQQPVAAQKMKTIFPKHLKTPYRT